MVGQTPEQVAANLETRLAKVEAVVTNLKAAIEQQRNGMQTKVEQPPEAPPPSSNDNEQLDVGTQD